MLATDETRVRITPRRASSVARSCARAASESRRIRPQRSSSQLAPARAWYEVWGFGTLAGIGVAPVSVPLCLAPSAL